jgi:ribose/xylose/arabinose/galactoside ABC-type transport system permease subunit
VIAAILLAVQHVWHFWLAVPLAAGAVALVLGLIAGYFIRVTRTRFPQR